jgi:hypothetical protein
VFKFSQVIIKFLLSLSPNIPFFSCPSILTSFVCLLISVIVHILVLLSTVPPVTSAVYNFLTSYLIQSSFSDLISTSFLKSGFGFSEINFLAKSSPREKHFLCEFMHTSVTLLPKVKPGLDSCLTSVLLQTQLIILKKKNLNVFTLVVISLIFYPHLTIMHISLPIIWAKLQFWTVPIILVTSVCILLLCLRISVPHLTLQVTFCFITLD